MIFLLLFSFCTCVLCKIWKSIIIIETEVSSIHRNCRYRILISLTFWEVFFLSGWRSWIYERRFIRKAQNHVCVCVYCRRISRILRRDLPRCEYQMRSIVYLNIFDIQTNILACFKWKRIRIGLIILNGTHQASLFAHLCSAFEQNYTYSTYVCI